MIVKKVFFICLFFALTACSVSKKLERKFEGSGREMLLNKLGEPKRIVKLEDGQELFIYEKETFIRETPIGTGRATLDPRISPAFTKFEIYRFTIDKNGIIVSTGYEKKIR